jgi:catecholate siderophore receptor
VQVDLSNQFKTGIFEHTLVAGVDFVRKLAVPAQFHHPPGTFTAGQPPGRSLRPGPHAGPEPGDVGVRDNNGTTQKVGGIYSPTRSRSPATSRSWDRSGRQLRDRLVASALNAPTTDQRKTDNFVNWRAGVVVHPVEKVSLYGMYGTSANPSAELGTFPSGTVTLDPEQNAIAEVGAKADLFEDRLGLTASLFRIDKLNARVPSPDGTGAMVLAGKQRVDGYSLGAAGTVVGSWRLLASYTFLDSTITENPNPALVGSRCPTRPKRPSPPGPRSSPSLDSRWRGAVYADAATVNNPTFAGTTAANLSFNKVPSYWRFDAFASYAWRALELQLNVYNLGNALYYEQYYAGHAVPAAGRSASLTATVRF